jgi:hypothetical protein
MGNRDEMAEATPATTRAAARPLVRAALMAVAIISAGTLLLATFD